MLRFILVMRQQEVGETPGNSSGFLTRCVLFEPQKTLIIELESQHQGGHHQLPGQGSPTERYPYYDNRYLQASLVEAISSQLIFFRTGYYGHPGQEGWHEPLPGAVPRWVEVAPSP